MKVLNVGGNSKAIQIPPYYDGWDHLLLDIDPANHPDVLCDARALTTLGAQQFDAVYCSHNLEHYYAHEVPEVLAGFAHVLNMTGFAEIRVPDIPTALQTMFSNNLDLEDTLYESPAGPIATLDVIYGWRKQIEQSGVDFYAHKTGFSRRSLERVLSKAFPVVFMLQQNLEIVALAFKQKPSPAQTALFNLPAM